MSTESAAGDSFAFLPHSTSQVDDVLQDLDLAETCELHYVIDPFELITFCFPLYRAWREKVPRSIVVDREIALYEVFYNHHNPPILLDEYGYELTGAVRMIEQTWKAWLQHASNLTFENLAPSVIAGTAKKIDLGSDFSVILAAAMGLFQESFERLRDVYSHRVARFDGREVSADRPVLQQIFATHRGTALIPELAGALYHRLVDEDGREGRSKVSLFWREKISRSSFVDAYAADRLFSINEAVEQEFQRGRLSRRHLFFLLSSAKRSQILFDLLYGKKGELVVAGKAISFLRAPSQVFLRLMEREQEPAESRANLEMIKKIIGTKSEIGVHASGIPAEKLETYRQKVASHYERAKNYLLLARLAEDERYDRLLEKAGGGRNVESAKQILRDIVADSQWPERARAIGSESIVFASAKVWFTKSLLQGLASLDPTALHSVRSGRDPVASSAQHLLSVFRVELSLPYADMLQEIQCYFRTPIQGRVGQGEIIRRVAEQFLELDSHTEELAEEHELMRCLLFFALPIPDADMYALDHAQEMSRKLEDRIAAATDALHRQRLVLFEKEFRCIICWAARRQLLHKPAETWAKESIEKYVDDPDPRFHHGRCLNLFAWFQGYRDGAGSIRKPPQELSIALAVEEAQRAIELYEPWGERAKNQIAALCNTIACLYVYRLDDHLYGVREARKFLELLKKCLSSNEWYDRYPEYFHTEAFVEHHEAKAIAAAGGSLEERLTKLNWAKTAIGFAYRIYETNKRAPFRHSDLIELLQRKILSEIEQLEGQIAARQRIEPPIVHIP